MDYTTRQRRDKPAVDAARDLAPLLSEARQYLATFHPRVCRTCHQVYAPGGRSGWRCLDCEHALGVAHGMPPLPRGGE